MQAAAVVIILAALAYILYLWSKRRHQIRCPECGAWIDVYADECPECGHTKKDVSPERYDKEVVEDVDPEVVGADTAEEAEEPVDYDEIVSGTIPEVKDAFDDHDLDPAKVLAAETANKDRVTLKDWLESRMD